MQKWLVEVVNGAICFCALVFAAGTGSTRGAMPGSTTTEVQEATAGLALAAQTTPSGATAGPAVLAQPATQKKVCEINADTAPPLSGPLAAAQKLYRTGKFDESIAAYNSIIATGVADTAAAYAGVARVYLAQKNPVAAQDAAQKAMALTPDRAPAIVALGEVYFRQGKMAEAEAAFLKPLAACNLDARAFLGLFRLYEISLNWKHAKKNIDQAYKLDPADPDVRREYLETLSGAEKIKSLKAYLDGESDDDDATRQGLKDELMVLESEGDHRTDQCRLVSQVSVTETKLSRLEDRFHDASDYKFVVPVKVNDTASKLVLDTGASGIIVEKSVAQRAKIKSIAAFKIQGIGDKGEAAAYVGHADRIQIGGLEFKDCLIQVTSNRALGGEGVIGADVFRNFLVDVDMTNEKLKLSELPPLPGEAALNLTLDSQSSEQSQLHDRYTPPEMKDYEKIFLIGHALLIPTFLNATPARLFLIDTGAFSTTLALNTAKEVTSVTLDSDTKVKGLSGEVKKVYSAAGATIHFSHYRDAYSGLVAMDLKNISDSMGTEVSGIIGAGTISMLEMKIDYRDGLVDFRQASERH
jgi:tetratricopeptide (TPR) repeat protein/predicted aspartyl protease